jgi:hypothetical protein
VLSQEAGILHPQPPPVKVFRQTPGNPGSGKNYRRLPSSFGLSSLHRPLVAASLWIGPQGSSVVIDLLSQWIVHCIGTLILPRPTSLSRGAIFRAGFVFFRHPPCNGGLNALWSSIWLSWICFFSEIVLIEHSGLDYTATELPVKGLGEIGLDKWNFSFLPPSCKYGVSQPDEFVFKPLGLRPESNLIFGSTFSNCRL